MKLFDCIIDDGKNIFRSFVAAKNKKQLFEEIRGNGQLEKYIDVTANYFTKETLDKLENDLRCSGWGRGERALILALVEEHMQHNKIIC